MLMKMKLRQIRILKVCLILIMSFAILPEVVYSFEDAYDKAETVSASSDGTSSCDEHNCPVLPDKPFHHCAVCCVISHFFTNQLTSINFHIDDASRTSSITERVLHKELFAKTLFRPPQSTL